MQTRRRVRDGAESDPPRRLTGFRSWRQVGAAGAGRGRVARAAASARATRGAGRAGTRRGCRPETTLEGTSAHH